MGNSQSTEAPRRQSHRLSKPRTSNHVTTTAGLLSPSGFSNSPTSRRFSNAQMSAALPPPPSPATSSTNSHIPETMREVDQPFERRPSVVSVEETESRRRRLFRSKSSQGPPKSEKRSSSFIASSRMADKLGRANSMTMTYESAISYYGPPNPNPDIWSGPPKSRASWNYDLSSYEAKRLLNLVEEPLEHGTALSEHNMTVVTETTWKSSNPANPASTPITRANSDVSLYMPVRRRSVIQKPGVATRSNSTRDGFAPSRPNFRYSHPPTPSLSRQQSFESYRSGVVSMPPRFFDAEVPRVVTPCEENYQSIGAFKLGSLRITNGAASPGSPEAEKYDKDEGAQGQIGGRAGYFLGVKSEAGLVASNALQIIMSSDEPPVVGIETTQPQPQSRASQSSPIANSFQKWAVNSDLSDPDPTLGDSTAIATDMPRYLDQINFSPFSLYDSPTPSPKLQTTSKSTAQEDQLFDDEPQPEYSSVEVLDVRVDPSAKSQHGQATDNDKMMTVERTDSGFVSITIPAPDVRHKPLTKADSGYSSNVSLRSLQLRNQVSDNESTGSLEKQSSISSQNSGLVPSERLVVAKPVPLPPQREAPPPPVSAPQREAPPPPVPPKDFPSSAAQQKSDAVPRKSLSTNTHSTRGFLSPANPFRNSKKTLTPIKNVTSTLTAPNSPLSESVPLSPASTRSFLSDNSGSALSISSGSQKPSKLQRLLSSARRPSSGSGPLTVHATHVSEKTGIPCIPRHVEHKLHEHTGMFPITTKRLALKPKSSMDTLKTIFSVGSIEASLDAVNSMSGARVSGVEVVDSSTPKEPLWRHTLQSVPAHIALVAAQVIPRKPIARKPIPARQESVKKTAVETEEATSLSMNVHDAAEQDRSLSTTRAERTMSLTLALEQNLEMKLARAGASVPNLFTDLPSPVLPSPLLARAPETKTKTPPPVSMMNRRPGSLRVPPPLRSQSSTASLNHRASRESLYSQSSAQSLARKTSRDNVHSYPSYQNPHAEDPHDTIPPVPTMDPRRISAFRPSQKVPNWDVQSDHGMVRQHKSARAPLEPVGRQHLLSSKYRSDGLGIQRSASAQGWKAETSNPPLRHRSSYDGYSHQQKHLKNGHPPSMSNGYTGPPKPMSTLIPVSGQFDLITSQWEQDSRYPPYVPRTNTHKRNRSMSGHGNNAPYRVLHSYNSPAYRNVPIWG